MCKMILKLVQDFSHLKLLEVSLSLTSLIIAILDEMNNKYKGDVVVAGSRVFKDGQGEMSYYDGSHYVG